MMYNIRQKIDSNCSNSGWQLQLVCVRIQENVGEWEPRVIGLWSLSGKAIFSFDRHQLKMHISLTAKPYNEETYSVSAVISTQEMSWKFCDELIITSAHHAYLVYHAYHACSYLMHVVIDDLQLRYTGELCSNLENS